jgi:hypothetical protein
MTQLSGQVLNGGIYRLLDESLAAAAEVFVALAYPAWYGRLAPFGCDWMGRIYAIDGSKRRAPNGERCASLLDPATRDLLRVPASVTDFHNSILVDDLETAAEEALWKSWRDSGGRELEYNEVVGWRTSGFLGGSLEVSNLEVQPARVYWELSGQLIAQTFKLQPGTSIKSATIEWCAPAVKPPSKQGDGCPEVRTLQELIDRDQTGWQSVKEWLAKATNQAVVLEADLRAREEALTRLQVTSRSPLGAIALETGGLLVDGGWVRVLGAESPSMQGIIAWNKLDRPDQAVAGAMLVGHDAIGGFFALNGGKWGTNVGGVFYWGQDTLEWTDVGGGYSGWLQWLLQSDLDEFYSELRWSGWRDEVSALSPDQGIAIYPFLWAKEGGPVGSRTRSRVPMQELWDSSHDMVEQLRQVPQDAPVRITFDEQGR